VAYAWEGGVACVARVTQRQHARARLGARNSCCTHFTAEQHALCAQEVSHERRQWWGGGAVPCDIGFGREQAVGLCDIVTVGLCEGGGRGSHLPS